MRAMDAPSALDTLSHDELRARLFPRVTSDTNLPDDPAFVYAPAPAPGLREVLALDLPESVQTLPGDALAALGDLAELRLRAMNNLRALPVEEHEVVTHEDGGTFHLLAGDSFFTASRVLVLDDLVRRITGKALGPDGALVAFPFRHVLAFHPITGMDVVPALNALARLRRRPARGSPRPGQPLRVLVAPAPPHPAQRTRGRRDRHHGRRGVPGTAGTPAHGRHRRHAIKGPVHRFRDQAASAVAPRPDHAAGPGRRMADARNPSSVRTTQVRATRASRWTAGPHGRPARPRPGPRSHACPGQGRPSGAPPPRTRPGAAPGRYRTASPAGGCGAGSADRPPARRRSGRAAGRTGGPSRRVPRRRRTR
ncbi:hypothetical protein ACU686_41510 [Yinghuangia aomiensis]